MENIRDTLSGKMLPEPSVQPKARISLPSSKKSQASVPTFQFLDLRKESGTKQDASWEKASALPGKHTMLSIGEFPSDAVESTLSDVLDMNAPESFYLSAKAATGILKRAEARGKELKPILKEALLETVRFGTLH